MWRGSWSGLTLAVRGGVRSPDAVALAAQITAQGDKVRDLKANKDPAVKEAVAALLALKEQYKALTSGGGAPAEAAAPAAVAVKVEAPAAKSAKAAAEVGGCAAQCV